MEPVRLLQSVYDNADACNVSRFNSLAWKSFSTSPVPHVFNYTSQLVLTFCAESSSSVCFFPFAKDKESVAGGEIDLKSQVRGT